MAWTHSERIAYQREWRSRNREALNSSRREKYSENREKEVARLHKWRLEHPDKVREQRLRSYASRRKKYPEMREKIQADIKEKRASNLERYRDYDRKSYLKHRQRAMIRAKVFTAKRRAVKLGAVLGNTAVIHQWQQSIRAMKWVRCHWCGTKVPGLGVHFDHVIALSRGGSHSIGNICAACPECNLSKNARAISDWVCNGQTFLSL
jgi:5-methylcytosine-specific restriction endonuclease McrA